MCCTWLSKKLWFLGPRNGYRKPYAFLNPSEGPTQLRLAIKQMRSLRLTMNYSGKNVMLLNRSHLDTLHSSLPLVWQGVRCHSPALGKRRCGQLTNLFANRLQNARPRCGFRSALHPGSKNEPDKNIFDNHIVCVWNCCWLALANCRELWNPRFVNDWAQKWEQPRDPKRNSGLMPKTEPNRSPKQFSEPKIG